MPKPNRDCDCAEGFVCFRCYTPGDRVVGSTGPADSPAPASPAPTATDVREKMQKYGPTCVHCDRCEVAHFGEPRYCDIAQQAGGRVFTPPCRACGYLHPEFRAASCSCARESGPASDAPAPPRKGMTQSEVEDFVRRDGHWRATEVSPRCVCEHPESAHIPFPTCGDLGWYGCTQCTPPGLPSTKTRCKLFVRAASPAQEAKRTCGHRGPSPHWDQRCLDEPGHTTPHHSEHAYWTTDYSCYAARGGWEPEEDRAAPNRLRSTTLPCDYCGRTGQSVVGTQGGGWVSWRCEDRADCDAAGIPLDRAAPTPEATAPGEDDEASREMHAALGAIAAIPCGMGDHVVARHVYDKYALRFPRTDRLTTEFRERFATVAAQEAPGAPEPMKFAETPTEARIRSAVLLARVQPRHYDSRLIFEAQELGVLLDALDASRATVAALTAERTRLQEQVQDQQQD